MPLVGGRIDVDMREDMVRRHTDLHAGNLGTPEKVPVLVDLQVFIPSDGLQDVAMGNEAVTNECALGDVADASIGTRFERVSVDDCAPRKDLGGSRNSVPPRSIYAKQPTRVSLPRENIRNLVLKCEAE